MCAARLNSTSVFSFWLGGLLCQLDKCLLFYFLLTNMTRQALVGHELVGRAQAPMDRE